MRIERIKNFKIISENSLFIEFEDGFSGEFKLMDHLDFQRPIEKELMDQKVFQAAELNTQFGSIEWPNGYDISPEFIRKAIAA